MAGLLIVWFHGPRASPPVSESAPASSTKIKPISRIPLAMNAVAIAVFFSCLWWPFGLSFLTTRAHLALAASGLAVVVADFIIVIQARRALGASWSLVPKASLSTGLATSGAYRWVRHPIYLGITLMFVGAAAAFANWLAMLLAFLVILPTLFWRAAIEERLLVQVFGDQHVAYRHRIRMIIPYVL